MDCIAPLPIQHYGFVAEVGVAVSAEVRTGVVRANVFRGDTTTRLALAFVLLRLLDMPPIEHIIFRADEIHQFHIIVKKPHHQIVVHALVVLNAIHAQVGKFATCGKFKSKFLIQLRKTLRKLYLFLCRELANPQPRNVPLHLAIRRNIDKTEKPASPYNSSTADQFSQSDPTTYQS